MTLWIDSQLSPEIAGWIARTFDLEAVPIRELGLRDAEYMEIFSAARSAQATVMTKDSDFVHLLGRFGPPPKM